MFSPELIAALENPYQRELLVAALKFKHPHFYPITRIQDRINMNLQALGGVKDPSSMLASDTPEQAEYELVRIRRFGKWVTIRNRKRICSADHRKSESRKL